MASNATEYVNFVHFVFETCMSGNEHDISVMTDLGNFMRETWDKYSNDPDRKAKYDEDVTIYIEKHLKNEHDKQLGRKMANLIKLQMLKHQWEKTESTLR